MKRKLLSIAIVLILVMNLGMVVSAEELETNDSGNFDVWWEGHGTYPVFPGDGNWEKMTYIEQLAACNVPEYLLNEYTTEELSEIVLNYPFLVDILVFDSATQGINHLSNISNVCNELFSRENATEVLLEKYSDLEVDYAMLAESYTGEANNIFVESQYMKELFLQTYFADSIDDLIDIEQRELTRIIGEKYDEKQGLCDNYVTGLLIYSWIQEEYGNVSQDLIPDNIIHELDSEIMTVSTDSNFTSSGYSVTTSIGASVEVGTYTLYGKSVGCYKYISGDFTNTEKNYYNSSFDSAHSSWNRLQTCTKKYNCHSYSWIFSSPYNEFWLQNPDSFATSISFTYVGANGSASAGDKVIIRGATSSEDGFGSYTNALHSLNVISSGTNSASILTESKLGAYGVYEASLMDMMSFYGGSQYSVYR